MGSGHITEVYRDLEKQFEQRCELLRILESHEENKNKVENLIKSQGLGLTFQPTPSGNIWENTQNLRENIERADQRIALHHKVAAERNYTPGFRMR